MNSVIYSRVSTEEQSKEGVSLENQVVKCRLQAQLNDLEIFEEIKDAGISAKNLNRPGIQRVLDLVKQKIIDSVIIFKLDRLTRNVSDLNNLIEIFNKAGVSLVSVKDSLDTKTASGRMVINILGTISQWERETIGERTAEAINFKKESGKVYNHTPYGWERSEGNLISNKKEQSIVVKILDMRSKGFSYQKIADYLEQSKILTKKGGYKWQKTVIKRICDRVSKMSKAA